MTKIVLTVYINFKIDEIGTSTIHFAIVWTYEIILEVETRM